MQRPRYRGASRVVSTGSRPALETRRRANCAPNFLHRSDPNSYEDDRPRRPVRERDFPHRCCPSCVRSDSPPLEANFRLLFDRDFSAMATSDGSCRTSRLARPPVPCATGCRHRSDRGFARIDRLRPFLRGRTTDLFPEGSIPC